MKTGRKRLLSDVKNRARNLAGSICGSALLRPVARRMFLSHTNVVYYHLIGERQPYYRSASDVEYTVDRFSRDLAELKKVFTFTTLEKICEHNRGDFASDRPLMALTFDDGFSLSGPELLQVFNYHDVKATHFLIMSCVDNRNLMWKNKIFAIEAMVPESIYVARYNELAGRAGLPPIRSRPDFLSASSAWSMSRKDEWADELWRTCHMPPLAEFLDEHRPYLSWKEIEEWLGAGHSVGLHTHTHPYCSRLTDDEIEQEIALPAEELRMRFNLGFLPFAYPFGDRIPAAKERALLERGIFDSVFGTRGFSRRGTAHHRLERAGIEEWGIGWPVFGRPMILCGLTGSAVR
jgi:peptidoglycan/xylan/chitin deacetylase (PgdA/CDA1 family)